MAKHRGKELKDGENPAPKSSTATSQAPTLSLESDALQDDSNMAAASTSTTLSDGAMAARGAILSQIMNTMDGLAKRMDRWEQQQTQNTDGGSSRDCASSSRARSSESEGEYESDDSVRSYGHASLDYRRVLLDRRQSPPPEDRRFQLLLDSLGDFFQAEAKTGPPLSATFAGLLNENLGRKPLDDSITKACDNYPIPDNVPRLAVPKLNTEVWNLLQKGARTTEVHLQKAQTTLNKGITGLARLLDVIGKPDGRKPLADFLDPLQDAFKLLIASSSYVSHSRKENVRTDIRHPNLKTQFAKLCSWATPIGETELFGPDILKQFDEVEKSTKLSDKKRSHRFQPYNRFSGSRRSGQSSQYQYRDQYKGKEDRKPRKPFLGKKASQKSKKN